MSISLIALVLLSFVAFIYALASRGRPTRAPERVEAQESTEPEYDEIRQKVEEAGRRYGATMAMRTSDDHAAFTAKAEETIDYIHGVQDRLDAMLEPIRSADGQLPREYSGYERDYQRLNQWLHDIIKSKGF
ncbi:MAG: hypothetical protein ACE5GW_06570 [Planctomycetota bacterium]